jgi:hypothetical protein
VPTARLLLLVNYRPEYQHGWGSKTYYTQLRLDPLPPVSAHELLHALLGDDSGLAPLTQVVITRRRAIRSSWKKACISWWRRGTARHAERLSPGAGRITRLYSGDRGGAGREGKR